MPARCNDLEQSHLAALLSARSAHVACEATGKIAGCLDRNNARMRYHAFRAQGLGVGTGMHWSVDAAHTTHALRCCILGGGCENYRAQRGQTPEKPGQRRTPDDERQPRVP